MSKSAAAFLTYNRQPALATALQGFKTYSPDTPVAVFDDAGYFDDTAEFLTQGRAMTTSDQAFQNQIEAVHYTGNGAEVYLGTRNLGVAGNSNRALHWFLTQTDADHFCLCNDDILVQGDFVAKYRRAHADLGVGLLCLMPFESDTYTPSKINYRGHKIKLCPRMTGIMMSFTRQCLEDVGYFDLSFKRFGNEHVDYTNRARFMGHISLDNQPQCQIDIVQDCVSFQDVRTSLWGPDREQADRDAELAMRRATMRYRTEGCWRPFATELPTVVGAHSGAGIPYDAVAASYDLISDHAPAHY